MEDFFSFIIQGKPHPYTQNVTNGLSSFPLKMCFLFCLFRLTR